MSFQLLNYDTKLDIKLEFGEYQHILIWKTLLTLELRCIPSTEFKENTFYPSK